MMKSTKVLLIAVAVVLMGVFTSCHKDDKATAAINNPAVVAKLKTQGFKFNNAGALILNNKALNAKSLDLSGTKVTVKDLAFVGMLPKVTELNLANNDYKLNFDFSELPANVKSVDLSGNEIYNYQGLLKFDEKTQEPIILRKMTSLILPHSAMYNVETLPFYFKQMGNNITMTMQNKDGKAEPYTTLREVPDPNIRAALKEFFPTKFDGDKIDLLKRFGDSKTTDLNVSNASSFFAGFTPPLNDKQITSVEGIEYITADPEWQGTLFAHMKTNKNLSLPYLKINKHTPKLLMSDINIGNIDLSSANSLIYIMLGNDKDIKTLDLSNTSIGKIGLNGAPKFGGSSILINSCDQLEQIILPDYKGVTDPLISVIGLYGLPELKTFNMSQLEWVSQMNLIGLPNISIEYPNIKFGVTDQNTNVKAELNKDITQTLAIDKAVYEMSSTKQYIAKMKNLITLDSSSGTVDDLDAAGTLNYNGITSVEIYDFNKKN